jgi:glycosidase
VPRFLFASKGDVQALHNALTLLFTEEGIPNIYYGTEQDLSGGNDPANREVLWNTGLRTDGATFTHIAKLARLRKAYVALRRADTNVTWSTNDVGTEDDAGIFAFERTGGDAPAGQYALVVLNTSDFKASATHGAMGPMQTMLQGVQKLVDVLDPAHASYSTDASGKLDVTVSAQHSMILVPEKQVVQGI